MNMPLRILDLRCDWNLELLDVRFYKVNIKPTESNISVIISFNSNIYLLLGKLYDFVQMEL